MKKAEDNYRTQQRNKTKRYAQFIQVLDSRIRKVQERKMYKIENSNYVKSTNVELRKMYLNQKQLTKEKVKTQAE